MPKLAFSVCRVGLGRVVLCDFLVGLLLAYVTKDAERTHEDESLDGHFKRDDGIYQVLGSFGVDAVKVVDVQTLGSTCRMNHIVELVSV